MSVRMLTTDLLSLLHDLALTAAAEPGLAGCAGILIHTARIDEGGEPGATGVLVGTSTTGTTIGHCWAEAGGDLAPTLLPIQYVRALRASLGKLLTRENRSSHVTDLRRDGTEVVVAEDPDLFGGGFSARVGAGQLDDWPRSVFQVLGETHVVPPAHLPRAEHRTDYAASRLAPFAAIAARHGGTLSLYRAHQGLPVHVQVGTHYRGVLMPSAQWTDGPSSEGRYPDIGVYLADLPPLETPAAQEPAPAA